MSKQVFPVPVSYTHLDVYKRQVLLKQDEQLAANLQQALVALVADPQRRLSMANAARTLAKPDAAERIADIILEESILEQQA